MVERLGVAMVLTPVNICVGLRDRCDMREARYCSSHTRTGVSEKICCDFACSLPSSISGTRSRAMRRWKAHDEKNYPIVFVFSFSLFAGLFCEKNILACCLA